MPRELAQIQADPQPHETVLLDGVARLRVVERHPQTVRYRHEVDGEPLIVRTVSLAQWRERIATAVPIAPNPGLLVD